MYRTILFRAQKVRFTYGGFRDRMWMEYGVRQNEVEGEVEMIVWTAKIGERRGEREKRGREDRKERKRKA